MKTASSADYVVGKPLSLPQEIVFLAVFFAIVAVFWEGAVTYREAKNVTQAGQRVLESARQIGTCITQEDVSPQPIEIVKNTVAFFVCKEWATHLFASTKRVMVGLVLGTIIGFPVAVLLVLSPFGRTLVKWIGPFAYSIARYAVFFFLVTQIGIENAKVAVNIWIAFFYQVILVMREAHEKLYRDPEAGELWDYVAVVGVESRLFFATHILIPMLVPAFFTAVVFTSMHSWTLLVVTEGFNSQYGLGALFEREMSYPSVSAGFAMAFLLALTSMAFAGIILAIRGLVSKIFHM